MSLSDVQTQRTIPAIEPAGPLGLGCAGLFGLPSRRDRRRVLEAAYDAGIRHFDVAPIYGLGRAEGELGHFVRTYGHDARIATKFGLSTTAAGRVAGAVQGPVRRLLRSSPATRAKVSASGRSPAAGAVGRVLYREPDYSVAAVRRSLEHSLQVMGVDGVDLLLVHEPALRPGQVDEPLVRYLDNCRTRGLINGWGPAGDLGYLAASPLPTGVVPDVLQHPYDLFSREAPPRGPRQLSIVFGFLSLTLPAVLAALRADAALLARCQELTDRDLRGPADVAALLVRDAVRNNRNGVALVSTTKVQHLEHLVSAMGEPGPGEYQALAEIVRRVRPGGGAQ